MITADDDLAIQEASSHGGRAFPSIMQMNDGSKHHCLGMSLRAYFAGQALAGMMTSDALLMGMAKPSQAADIAVMAVRAADALIAELGK